MMVALCFGLWTAGEVNAGGQRVYDIHVPAQGVADALNTLSEQTSVPVVFPYDLVSKCAARAVLGRYTLLDALAALLAGTGLSGGLTDKGVLTVSLSKPGAHNCGETNVSRNEARTQNLEPTKPGNGRIGAFFAAIAAAFNASGQDMVDSAQGAVEEIIVTAQKREERLQEVPVPVSVVSAGRLIDTNQVRIVDYYTSVPGLSVITHEGGSWAGLPKLVIRGITTGGFSSPTVGIVVDDVPYGSQGAGSLSITAPDIDPNDLARVEVLRGPQGTLYGASSMGGLLKYVTVDPSTDAVSGSLQVGGGGIAHGDETGYSVRGAVNVPLGDAFAVRATAFTRQDPGYIDDPRLGVSDINSTQADGGRVSALWRPSEMTSFKLSALYQQVESDGSSFMHVQPGLRELQQNAVRGTGGFSRESRAFSALVQTALGGGELTVVGGYLRDDLFNNLDMSPFFGGIAQGNFGVNGTFFLEGGETSKATQEVRFVTPIGQRLEWLFGAFHTREESRYGWNLYAADPLIGEPVSWMGRLNGSNEFREVAAFTNLTVTISDRFDLQLGARGSEMEGTKNSETRTGLLYGNAFVVVPPVVGSKHHAVTYLVTPRFKFSSDLMVYARLASGYRPGGGGVSGQGDDQCLTYNTPCEFDPDKTQNYEIGVKGDMFADALSFDASVYYIDWNDIQIERIAQQGPGFAYVTNAGGARSQGLELALEARPLDGMVAAVSATWSDAELTDDFPPGSSYGVAGDRLPYSSRFSGALSLDQEFALSNRLMATVGGSVAYVGERPGIFTGSAERQMYPAYAQTNVHAGARYGSWSANLFVNNLTDKRVVVSGGVGSLIPFAFTPLQPRTIGLSFTRTFGIADE
jgi:iron complex outermembrane recepter protein